MTWRQLGGLFLLSAMWGGSFLFIKIAVVDVAPMTLVTVRLLGAALVLLGILRARKLHLPHDLASWRGFVLLAMIGLVIPFWLITWGEQYISSGLAAIVLATTPLLTILLTVFVMRGERLGFTRILGLLLGFAGVVVAVGEGLQPGASLLGRLAVLGAALCYAASGLYARAAFRDTPPLVLAAGQMTVGGLLALPLALTIDPLPTHWPSALSLGALLALAVVCTALAYIIFYWLVSSVGATRSSLVTYLTPGFALFYGTVLLSEPFTLQIGFGLVLIVLGILVTTDRLSLHLLTPGLRRILGKI